MAIYYGVVRENRIELERGARLAEGVRVEVRPAPHGAVAADTADRGVGAVDTADAVDTVDTVDAVGEEVVQERLRAAGLLAPTPGADDPAADMMDEEAADAFEPVAVQGEPLSEQIIRERR